MQSKRYDQVQPIEGSSLYKRISLEMMHQYPGQVYLRLEPISHAPVIMIQVMPGDIAAISLLGDPKEELADADDDFQPGDSG